MSINLFFVYNYDIMLLLFLLGLLMLLRWLLLYNYIMILFNVSHNGPDMHAVT